MTLEDIALQMTPGIGVKGAAHLLEVFGDARRIFAASHDELAGAARLRPEPLRAILQRKGFPAAERELLYCRRNGIRPIASTDPEYPPLLRDIPDPPHVIYLRGELRALHMRCLSVVGTRTATPYGETMCHALIERLAERVDELSIVSGLAFGIDAAAHRAALACRVPTVAVVANPLPGVTPTQHAGLARDILEQGGALLTELHSQTRQNGSLFLARNRIIAALSAGTLVVESPASGGSLFTAHCADGYNRTVMALPGRVTDRMSAGTNFLIRNQKAQMILTADDIITELQWENAAPQRDTRTETPGDRRLTPDERAAGLLPHGRPPLARDARRAERTRPGRAGHAAGGARAERRRPPAPRQPIHETAMRLIDTHSHLYEPEFDADRDEALARAAAAGVERLLLPAIDSESHERLFALSRRDPARYIPMMGLHPTSVNDNPRWREELALVERLLDAPPEGIGAFCAVGEIGLDFYWSRDFMSEQCEAFAAQLRMAWRRGLPVAIHTRAAWDEMERIIAEESARARSEGATLRGVFHAFSEDEGRYARLRACGDWLFGIGGVVTFKRSQVAASVPAMELDDLVLETDCPYLTPVPHRGERNESAYVRFVCERVAALKGLPPEEVARRTTASAERMFGLGALPAAEEPERAAAEVPGKAAAEELGKAAAEGSGKATTEGPDTMKTPASEGAGRTIANN